MALNKSTGNMYPWITHTWNPVRGRCTHQCSYCFMRRTWSEKNVARYVAAEQRTDLGSRKKIFVGSSIDMWAEEIPDSWILLVLAMCHNYPANEYLFQTKNPKRFHTFKYSFPPQSILGITLESNRDYPDISKAPPVRERVEWMKYLKEKTYHHLMISIEPVMDFDIDEFVSMIQSIRPAFVSIGADSKHHGLPEPTLEKIGELLIGLRTLTDLRIKNNLKRLL